MNLPEKICPKVGGHGSGTCPRGNNYEEKGTTDLWCVGNLRYEVQTINGDTVIMPIKYRIECDGCEEIQNAESW